MKMIWNKLRKYSIFIIMGIISIFGIIWMLIKNITSRRINKIDQTICTNENEINKIEGKIEVLDEQKQQVLDDIQETKTEIENLQQVKKTPAVKRKPRTTKSSKENILNKTKRTRKKDA